MRRTEGRSNVIHHPGRELTNAEIAQQDRLESACHSLVCDMVGEKVNWDIEWIGPIAETVAMIVCETLKLAKYEEFYPYINTWEDADLGQVTIHHADQLKKGGK